MLAMLKESRENSTKQFITDARYEGERKNDQEGKA